MQVRGSECLGTSAARSHLDRYIDVTALYDDNSSSKYFSQQPTCGYEMSPVTDQQSAIASVRHEASTQLLSRCNGPRLGW